jgi:DNA-binding IclR family transcriptional regulator
MPVFGVHDKLIAALALTGPASRLTEDRKTSGISQLMQETANRLSLKLGPASLSAKRFTV